MLSANTLRAALTGLLVTGVAAVALAPGLAAVPAPGLVVQGDRIVGGVPIGAKLAQARLRFGGPTQVRRVGVYNCRATWRALGLSLLFIDLSQGSPCANGTLDGATMTSRRWRTAKGLRIGDPAGRLQSLYPKTTARAGYYRGRWLIVRHACTEVGGQAYPGLLARTVGGKVSALVVSVAACE